MRAAGERTSHEHREQGALDGKAARVENGVVMYF
jgi:hypothetical protein